MKNYENCFMQFRIVDTFVVFVVVSVYEWIEESISTMLMRHFKTYYCQKNILVVQHKKS